MSVPTEELKLEIANAATGKTLGVASAPGADGALVAGDFTDDGHGPEQWHFALAQEPEDQLYVIRNAVTGQVLDNPGTADSGVSQSDAADGKLSQQWRVVPVDGEPGVYFIEGESHEAVLDLADPDAAETRIVLREYDEDAKSQRWRLVPAEPERVSDPVLRWAPLSHWNGRQSWRLTRSPALRPAPGAAPAFSDLLLVLDQLGSDEEAGGWQADEAARPRDWQPGWWPAAGARFLADTAGAKRKDIVALERAKGAVTWLSRGDGTFDEESVLHKPMPSASPADLWTLADTTGGGRTDIVVLSAGGVRVSVQEEDGTYAAATVVVKAFGHGKQGGEWLAEEHPRFLVDVNGDGRLDIVGCHDDGVWVSRQDEEGNFAALGDEPALAAFGHGEEAGGWLAGKHPRFLADVNGDGRLDIVGCHDDGVWVSYQDEEGQFAEPLYVLDDFGVDQGWTSVDEYPRFLLSTVDGGPADIVGFGPQGVVVARGRGDGTFEPSQLVLNDFGRAQGWTCKRHLRLLADVTGDGHPDIVGFGDEGVWVSHNRGDGQFDQAQFVCRGFGYNQDAGSWRVGRHPRFIADITGEGRPDIVGFGGPGVYVARNLFRRFRTR